MTLYSRLVRRRPVKYLATAILLLPMHLTFARTMDVCPVLPPKSGLVWFYQEGPDFDVCYAQDEKTEKTAFGVYLGFAPSFRPEESTQIGQGTVGGHAITWHRQNVDSTIVIGRQALVKLGGKRNLVAHVWVGGDTEERLVQQLRVLAHIRFKL